ncbi:Hypothetical predicted protein, partial [Marmota monax]
LLLETLSVAGKKAVCTTSLLTQQENACIEDCTSLIWQKQPQCELSRPSSHHHHIKYILFHPFSLARATSPLVNHKSTTYGACALVVTSPHRPHAFSVRHPIRRTNKREDSGAGHREAANERAVGSRGLRRVNPSVVRIQTPPR